MISEKQLAANRSNAETNEAVRPYPPNTDRAGSTSGQGPTSEAGRNRSRMNALRHGLTGQVTTMTDEDRAAHDQFSKALMQDLAPDGATVTFDKKVRPYPRNVLAKRTACGRRISAIEDNLFALGQLQNADQPDWSPLWGPQRCPDVPQIDAALISARVFTLESKQLQLLTLYEQRINRSLQKNLAMLQALQSVRKREREAKMKEASALLKLGEMKGLEYFPAKAAQAEVRCAANSRQDGFVFSALEIHAAIDRQQRLERAAATDFTKFRSRKFQAAAA
jgi:hypothetical protein